MYSVEVENITKRYNHIEALKDLSFNVEAGSLFGIIGPDGSGKTTLFRILATLILPSSGYARVLGMDAVKDFKKIRKIMGYMPGKFSLYQDLTVEENLKFFATSFNTNLKENYDTIKDIYSHIEPFKKRRAGKLSGGMKQKLALSCALIHNPKILILDEPTTGVDAVSRKEFWEILNRLKNLGITILVSTPYMEEASLCDKIALLQNGEILKIESPDKISLDFNRRLFSISSENTYRLISDLKNYKYCETVFPFGQNVHFTAKSHAINGDDIRAYLIEKGRINIVVEEIQPGIEDSFMFLMLQKNHAR